MIQPSEEQIRIIQAPIAPMSVVACAGSGKTFTAVRRLAQIRQDLGESRGRVALLSFSNVAVDTFRREYHSLRNASSIAAHERVEIDTLDAFFTSNVLLPHAYRTMGARQAAFLVMGSEAFLSGFSFPTNTYPRAIAEMQVDVDDRGVHFCYLENDRVLRLDQEQATRLVHRLGRVGAYTHNLGRYWCFRTLTEQADILRALVRRYPHILIDEAQDIGKVHEAIIEQLIGAGCQVSLIGDPNQGIYEFAGANGGFLTRYGYREGVQSRCLTRNFRSVVPILDLANALSSRADTADRAAPSTTHGAFFVPYRNAERDNLISAFNVAVLEAELRLDRAAVLCRGRQMANTLAGNKGAPGQGRVKALAQAAILRDRNQDFLGAFELVVDCIIGLLDNPPQSLATKVMRPARYPDARALRRLIWAFTRDPDSGLPKATLIGDTQWHPQMLTSVKALLARIEQDHGLTSLPKLGNKLAKKGLTNSSLFSPTDLVATDGEERIRVDTVHQAKGESLDAVLYLATKEHVNALLAGVDTELGRIGYVAVTRARNLLWLGVPANAMEELRPALLARGFRAL